MNNVYLLYIIKKYVIDFDFVLNELFICLVRKIVKLFFLIFMVCFDIIFGWKF